jgi:putative membrane protein insertion efficiency factor
MGKLGTLLRSLLAAVLIAAVRCYQLVVRPLFPAVCRFSPSCSEYFIQAVHQHGPLRGASRGIDTPHRAPTPRARGGWGVGPPPPNPPPPRGRGE